MVIDCYIHAEVQTDASDISRRCSSIAVMDLQNSDNYEREKFLLQQQNHYDCSENISMQSMNQIISEEEEDTSQEEDNDDDTEKEIQRRLNPKCEGDLKLVHLELLLWKENKHSQIAKEIADDTKRAMYLNLLSQETKLIRHLSISNKNVAVQKRIETVKNNLRKMAFPKHLSLQHTRSDQRVFVASCESANAEKLFFLIEKMELIDLQQTGKSIIVIS